ncbi:glyoxalase [Nocardia beijingensis]|uniref:glyoxalase n=1 Tax=Nocardia beijingensis TaxID=95162 RepID=UPI0018940DCE|nr:glyoxalase [Nocardia beijingensis]MBF6463979.1 glyoxalase [Nocardia beijingensis]
MIHHVQLCCPAGAEDRQRGFYRGVPGWTELPKPPRLAGRGGPDGELHIGVEADVHPATKAHPAFVVDIDATAEALASAGYLVVWADPAEIPGRRRFHTHDAVGNRVEFLAA